MTTEERREYMRKYRESHKEQIMRGERERRVNKFISGINGDPGAVLEWIKNHSWNPAWCPIAGYWRRDGFPVAVLHNEQEEYGYCVQCAGSGHYFKTDSEAYQFIYSWKGKRKLKAT